MSRRRRAIKRPVVPDPVYGSEILSKFVNHVMESGKKSVARRIVYRAIDKFAKKVKAENPLAAFEQAVENAKPALEVKSRRIGGATYQVPVEIAPERRASMGMRWIIQFSEIKQGVPWKMDSLLSLLIATKIRAQQSKRKMIRIVWRKLTKHLHTTNGKPEYE